MAKDKHEESVMLSGPEDLESWKFELKVQAVHVDCWEIITGIAIPPAAGDNSNRAKAYRKRNAHAAQMIVKSVSRSLYPHIREFDDNPHAMYQRLIDVNTGGFEELGDYWTSFQTIQMRSSETAMSFIATPSELQSISLFLGALPKTQDWKSFIAILKRDIQGDDLDFVIREVLREYKRQTAGSDDEVPTDTHGAGNDAMVASGCISAKAREATRPMPGPHQRGKFKCPNLVCNLCGGVGHFRSVCSSELVTLADFPDAAIAEEEEVNYAF
ncbi:hypothetical protein BDN72DRAFT_907294 [Pluteus cervinus]|uniref:Uncharacterized protein n=1 Tax=Pluteus cervinus TaxID=181527 RepID=A0ACD2ZX31_9AGAR|nr:hypothetical protein BDN72DRAFT_907294 [Pluteus cervinus]